MAKYYRQQGETKQRKFLRRFRPFVVLVFVSSLFVVGWFAYDIYAQTDQDTTPVTSQATTSTIATKTQVVTTPYFQIQLPMKWRAVANETRDGYYVFKKFNGQLIEQDLIIDVNNPSQVNLATTRINRTVVIEQQDSSGMNIVNQTLENCQKIAKGARAPFMAMLSNANFPCNPESTLFEVTVSQVGRDNIMNLRRPDGSSATYQINYRDLTANPTGRDGLDLIRSFETR